MFETFYVYSLSDPIDGKVFYIGKGQGKRIDAHEKEARNGVHSAKCDKIREIWSYGRKVKKTVIKDFASENDALEYEFTLINEIGLENLTNVFHGGMLGVVAFLERRERRRKAKAKRMAEAEYRKNLERNVWSARRKMQQCEEYGDKAMRKLPAKVRRGRPGPGFAYHSVETDKGRYVITVPKSKIDLVPV